MTGRRRVTMTPELLGRMVQMLPTAKSLREISRKTGVPLASVRNHLAPYVADAGLPSMAVPRRAPITPVQVAEMAERMLTATSFREIAKDMDLDRQTVTVQARPIIAAMRAAGTLGLCGCGKERFHPRICVLNVTGNHKRWGTSEHVEKRDAIIAAIMAGETYADIGRRWGIGQRGALGYAARHLTVEQRERRKVLEHQRVRHATARTEFRPHRDDVYAQLSAAMPRWLSDASRDDALSDLYVAYLEGRLPTDVAGEAKRFANRTVAAFESKFGPRSLDERLFDDSDLTLGETLVDPAALDAFDYIFEEVV